MLAAKLGQEHHSNLFIFPSVLVWESATKVVQSCNMCSRFGSEVLVVFPVAGVQLGGRLRYCSWEVLRPGSHVCHLVQGQVQPTPFTSQHMYVPSGAVAWTVRPLASTLM